MTSRNFWFDDSSEPGRHAANPDSNAIPGHWVDSEEPTPLFDQTVESLVETSQAAVVRSNPDDQEGVLQQQSRPSEEQ